MTASVAINPFPSKGELVVLFAGNEQTGPTHQVGPQVRDYHLVHYVVSGRGRFRCMGRDYELGPGELFFIFPGELVYYESDADDPWRYRWIGFRGENADRLLAMVDLSPHRPTLRAVSGRRNAALFHTVERTLLLGDPGCDLRAEGYMRLLLGDWAQSRMSVPASKQAEHPARHHVEQAIRWLNLQYSKPISIEEMAHTFGYHRTYLSKIFKQFTGLPPMGYLLKVRMERARQLLQEPLTIEQVASSVGYPDALYFSKQFKKWYGCTPSEFRTQHPNRQYEC
ncbi:AraC family transcriptional regulator [Gordoniibacillus kamchatkensis]|uniref:AraC family transcriptional regulator n=1 Tax=Gordoniibacillus kamchatkensis TaxID=1590651 RepID=A0ABR5A6W6_9BACL|nr:AraC family transcriptional regulator [Paenibacillus sp. VKM B-2647]KIL36809.1 AraC family transcriptional regulator [Paenibacillus sp. VKM B-2647]